MDVIDEGHPSLPFKKPSGILDRACVRHLKATETTPPTPPPPPKIPIPDAENRIVVYFTSLPANKSELEDGWDVRSILRRFRVLVDERDLSMDATFQDDLQQFFGGLPINLTSPKVFIGVRYIGGVEEITKFQEAGELNKLVEGLTPAVPLVGRRKSKDYDESQSKSVNLQTEGDEAGGAKEIRQMQVAVELRKLVGGLPAVVPESQSKSLTSQNLAPEDDEAKYAEKVKQMQDTGERQRSVEELPAAVPESQSIVAPEDDESGATKEIIQMQEVSKLEKLVEELPTSEPGVSQNSPGSDKYYIQIDPRHDHRYDRENGETALFHIKTRVLICQHFSVTITGHDDIDSASIYGMISVQAAFDGFESCDLFRVKKCNPICLQRTDQTLLLTCPPVAISSCGPLTLIFALNCNGVDLFQDSLTNVQKNGWILEDAADVYGEDSDGFGFIAINPSFKYDMGESDRPTIECIGYEDERRKWKNSSVLVTYVLLRHALAAELNIGFLEDNINGKVYGEIIACSCKYKNYGSLLFRKWGGQDDDDHERVCGKQRIQLSRSIAAVPWKAALIREAQLYNVDSRAEIVDGKLYFFPGQTMEKFFETSYGKLNVRVTWHSGEIWEPL